MHHTIQVTIEGTTDLVFDNPESANPISEVALKKTALNKAQKKKDVTPEKKIEILQELADLEVRHGWYHNGERPYFPIAWVLKSLNAAARDQKLGKAVDRSVSSPMQVILPEFRGGKDLDSLVANPHFRWTRTVASRNGANIVRVVKSNPVIPSGWKAKIILVIDDTKLTVDNVIAFLDKVGRFAGFGPGRSMQRGRFNITKVERLAAEETEEVVIPIEDVVSFS